MGRHLRTGSDRGRGGRRRHVQPWGVAWLLVVGIVLASCSGATTPDPAPSADDGETADSADEAGEAGDAASGGRLIVAEGIDSPDSMDPHVAIFDVTWRLQDLVYDTLVTVDEDAQLQPRLAESWEQTSETTYLFRLREDVTFSNGRALTVEDVVGSFERLLDPDTGAFWPLLLGPVESVTAVDGSAVEFELASPYTPFLAAMANMSTAILPMEELGDGSFDPETQMLGTGPFVLLEHLPDQSWTFERNEQYWGEPSAADEVEIRIIPDDSARIAALRSGSVHVASFATPDAPVLLGEVPEVDVTVQGSTEMYLLILNGVAPDSPFVDANVRQAVDAALDRDAILGLALAGLGEQTALTPVGLPDACAPAFERDIDRAIALLEDAGAEGLSFELIVPPTLPSFAPIGQIIQQNLAEAGIDVSLRAEEEGRYIERVYIDQPGDFDAVLDFFAGYADPGLMLQYLVPERSFVTAGFVEQDPAITEAVDASSRVEPGDERAQLLSQACDLISADATMIPLATKPTTIGVRADLVDGAVPGFDGYGIHLRNLAEMSLRNG